MLHEGGVLAEGDECWMRETSVGRERRVLVRD